MKVLNYYHVDSIINDSEQKKPDLSKIDYLDIVIDATHGGYVNKNKFFYVIDGMKRAVKTWTAPYEKPVIKEHSSAYGDPIGRVYKAEFISTEKGRGFIRLYARITDIDAIQKIMDGRLKTVSTGGSPVDKVECSICGKDMREGRCAHVPGYTYPEDPEDENSAQKLCYWMVHELEYNEVSFTYKPADVNRETGEAALVTEWKIGDAIVEDYVPKVTDRDMEREDLHIRDVHYAEEVPVVHTSNTDQDYYCTIADFIEQDDTSDPSGKGLDDRFTFEITTTMTTKSVQGLKHRHYFMVDGAGNGYTSHAAGHSHAVVDNKVMEAKEYDAAAEDYVAHTHDNDKTAEASFDTMFKDEVIGYSDKAGVAHKHVLYTDYVDNGSSSWVLGHAHKVVDGQLLAATARDDDAHHTHTDLADANAQDMDTMHVATILQSPAQVLRALDYIHTLDREQKDKQLLQDRIMSEPVALKYRTALLDYIRVRNGLTQLLALTADPAEKQ